MNTNELLKKWGDRLNNHQLIAVHYSQDEKDVPKDLIDKISVLSEIYEDLIELKSLVSKI